MTWSQEVVKSSLFGLLTSPCLVSLSFISAHAMTCAEQFQVFNLSIKLSVNNQTCSNTSVQQHHYVNEPINLSIIRHVVATYSSNTYKNT